MANEFGKTYQDRLADRAADAAIYEMLLKHWLDIWDDIEELVSNGLTHQDIEAFAQHTREQLNYHKKDTTNGSIS